MPAAEQLNVNKDPMLKILIYRFSIAGIVIAGHYT